MSNFEVKVQKIFIKPHPNADKLELGNIGHQDGFQVVVGKGLYKTGDLVAYIGENAVVPEWVLKQYGYWNTEKDKGMLAGTKGNRVKACKLRDQFSLGICIPVIRRGEEFRLLRMNSYSNNSQMENLHVYEGQDVSEWLGVTKYEPPIPTCLAGEVFNAGTELTLNYDIENIKNYPDIFDPEELVQVSEKLHGTLCCVTYIPPNSCFVNGEQLLVQGFGEQGYFAISSKGLGSKGLCFKWNEVNSNNLYQKTVKNYLKSILKGIHLFNLKDEVVMIYGEVFGNGVQDLQYGMKQNEVMFRVFDVYTGIRGQGKFMDDWVLDNFCEKADLQRVPILYRGVFDMEVISALCEGAKSTFDDNTIMEGVVIKSLCERTTTPVGRACAKLVSQQYLLRKGNVTEFN